ncbi:MAG: EAL domain-containing protein [Alphaproteobacteria bacterium]|nr:EAL domain-containing protein [Alphaproteobacteria bacterium]
MSDPDSNPGPDSMAEKDHWSIKSRFAHMEFDDLPQMQAIVELAVNSLGCPSAMLTMLEDNQHRVVASFGLVADDVATAKSCASQVADDSQLFIVEDVSSDERFRKNALHDEHSNISFYVGLPLSIDTSGMLGVLSVFDTAPRTLSDSERHGLFNLQLIVNSLLASYEAHRIAQESQDELHITLENMDQGVTVFDADANMILWNQRYIDIFEKSPEDIYKGVSLQKLIEVQDLQNGFEGFDGGYEQMLAELRAGLARGEIVPGGVRLNSGRIISSVHAAMPNGGWVATHSDITERVRAQEKIEHASLHDSLTGLGNRAKFANEFETRIADSSKRVAVMLIDIDEFKQVNDNFGHGAGDAVIVSVADRLMGCVRSDDVVVRLGGDEFAVLLQIDQDCDDEIVISIARKVVNRMREELQYRKSIINFSVSVGCYESSSQTTGLEEILTRADFALYKAKANGRSRFQMFNRKIEEELSRTRRIQTIVRSAESTDNLMLEYQPIVCLDSKQDYGFEALIRWNGDPDDRISPQDIILATEKDGFIGHVGNWVLNKAMQQASKWNEAIHLSVNVSPKQLGMGDFVDHVRRALKHWKFAPERLELEVTETALLQDRASISELHEIKGLGVRIALDDFGTGYSSLTHLQLFPFDKLKIDRSFVDQADTDKLSNAIVRSIVHLADELSIQTVAEGIETNEQLTEMTSIGCTMGQGYLLGRPMSAKQARQRIAAMNLVA